MNKGTLKLMPHDGVGYLCHLCRRDEECHKGRTVEYHRISEGLCPEHGKQKKLEAFHD